MPNDFENTDLLLWLEAQPHEVLDSLQYGVVKMDTNGTVVYYNQCETEITGVLKDTAMHKHFFTEVAPCTNNFMVADKYKNASLDERLQYIFTYVTQPIFVELRLLKAEATHQYMLVKKV